MILLNTTYYVHVSCRAEFLAWVRSEYIAQALQSGIFTDPLLLMVEHQVEPDALTYAVQMKAQNVAKAKEWHDCGDGLALRDVIMKRFPQKVLFFSSFMDIMPL